MRWREITKAVRPIETRISEQWADWHCHHVNHAVTWSKIWYGTWLIPKSPTRGSSLPNHKKKTKEKQKTYDIWFWIILYKKQQALTRINRNHLWIIPILNKSFTPYERKLCFVSFLLIEPKTAISISVVIRGGNNLNSTL